MSDPTQFSFSAGLNQSARVQETALWREKKKKRKRHIRFRRTPLAHKRVGITLRNVSLTLSSIQAWQTEVSSEVRPLALSTGV